MQRLKNHTTHLTLKIAAVGLLISTVFTQCKKEDEQQQQPPPVFNTLEEEIDYLVGQYLHVGMVVGVIDKKQQKRIFTYGSKTTASSEVPDANTVFEIGSISKSFTCLLAKQLMRSGLLQNDTAQVYLTDGEVTLPVKDSAHILLYHLMTHTSGIPRSPQSDEAQLPPSYSRRNPYACFTTEYMYDYFTSHCNLLFKPGETWEYSNSGMGLLGHIIGLADETSYETVLKREIFDVLGMENSSLFLTQAQKENYALGYNIYLTELPEFTAKDIFQGVGFIKSSLTDMFMYLEAQMGLAETSLREAMDDCQMSQFEIYYWGHQCFGWYKKTLGDGQLITYCGGNTIGFGSYIGFNKTLSTGVILWYNFDDGANLVLGPAILEAINKY
jgi:CubicO group peptidase (beta-lactamase class C family)